MDQPATQLPREAGSRRIASLPAMWWRHRRPPLTLAYSFALAALVGGPAAADVQPPLVIDMEPAAPPLDRPGRGPCLSAANTTLQDLEGLTVATISPRLNALLDRAADRVDRLHNRPCDFSNNGGPSAKHDDFTTPWCGGRGCPFGVDPERPLVMRLRGYFNVPAAMAGRPLHFGFFYDDEVALTLFDAAGGAHPVFVGLIGFGRSATRATRAVTIVRPGLYPVEIVYAQHGERADLELSMLDQRFADFDEPPDVAAHHDLRAAGFSLLLDTQFSPTIDGGPPSADPHGCSGCRADADCPGAMRCDAVAHACVPIPCGCAVKHRRRDAAGLPLAVGAFASALGAIMFRRRRGRRPSRRAEWT